MKEIFYELIKEASEGLVIIDGEEWPIGFNTLIYRKEEENLFYECEQNNSTLVINNEENFFEVLSEYIFMEFNKKRKIPTFVFDDLKNRMKFIIVYLFVNATTEDFNNPIHLIRRNIAFLQDDTFSYLNDAEKINIGDNFFGSSLILQNVEHSVAMETPNKIYIGFSKVFEEGVFHYPVADITYGVVNEDGEKVCYIYSLMKPKDKREKSKEEEKYQKKMDRYMYKLNDGVKDYESNEYFEYKDGLSKYYPENISDVTPSFVFALSVFMALLEREKITKVKAVPYLPLRYLSRDIAASEVRNDSRKETLYNRNLFIQKNITDKFIRTFMRVKFHLKELKVLSYPYELDEFLWMDLENEHLEIDNYILNNVFAIVIEHGKKKSLY